MSEAILTKKNHDFNDAKRTLLRQKNMDVYWRYSVIEHFRWYLNVCSSILRAPMMFLFRWAILSQWARLFSQRRITISMTQSGPYWDRKTWTFIEGTRSLCISRGTWIVCSSSLRAPMMFLIKWASEQQYHTDYTGSSFQVWRFEFPSRLIFNSWIWSSVVHSCSKMVESRPASDRSFLRIERAYFNQLSPCCDNSDDVFDNMVFNIFSMNLSRNLRWRYARVAESFFLIREVECVVAWCAFLSCYKTLLNPPRHIDFLLSWFPWL